MKNVLYINQLFVKLILKVTLKYNMYNPQSKDIMQSNVHKMLLDTTMNSNNESRVENSSACNYLIVNKINEIIIFVLE